MEFPSKLIENAVGELSRLPGIGRKTALRLALHLLKAEMDTTASLAEALVQMQSSKLIADYFDVKKLISPAA